ncbi:hypothetical protein SNE40_000481 [Patella caerulea]|uniref:Fatty acid desaturase domain-containing protein n=1 Tax=Patella caerulea TaxID=87958 RepID=A0AAN8KJV7_PATCE
MTSSKTKEPAIDQAHHVYRTFRRILRSLEEEVIFPWCRSLEFQFKRNLADQQRRNESRESSPQDTPTPATTLGDNLSASAPTAAWGEHTSIKGEDGLEDVSNEQCEFGVKSVREQFESKGEEGHPCPPVETLSPRNFTRSQSTTGSPPKVSPKPSPKLLGIKNRVLRDRFEQLASDSPEHSPRSKSCSPEKPITPSPSSNKSLRDRFEQLASDHGADNPLEHSPRSKSSSPEKTINRLSPSNKSLRDRFEQLASDHSAVDSPETSPRSKSLSQETTTNRVSPSNKSLRDRFEQLASDHSAVNSPDTSPRSKSLSQETTTNRVSPSNKSLRDRFEKLASDHSAVDSPDTSPRSKSSSPEKTTNQVSPSNKSLRDRFEQLAPDQSAVDSRESKSLSQEKTTNRVSPGKSLKDRLDKLALEQSAVNLPENNPIPKRSSPEKPIKRLSLDKTSTSDLQDFPKEEALAVLKNNISDNTEVITPLGKITEEQPLLENISKELPTKVPPLDNITNTRAITHPRIVVLPPSPETTPAFLEPSKISALLVKERTPLEDTRTQVRTVLENRSAPLEKKVVPVKRTRISLRSTFDTIGKRDTPESLLPSTELKDTESPPASAVIPKSRFTRINWSPTKEVPKEGKLVNISEPKAFVKPSIWRSVAAPKSPKMKIDEIEFQTTAAAEPETANKADPQIPELTVSPACSVKTDPSINNEQNGYPRHRSTTNGKTHESSVLNGHDASHVKDNGKVDMLTAKLPTLSEIKAALPRHCFRPTVTESMYYVAKDIILVAAMFGLAQWLLGFKSYVLIALLTPIYWFAQGTLFFSIFVLGHDCNHGSFSSYALLNDCLGTVLHTLVMTPYYPWKLSHRHHHNNTGNMDKDEIFYPVREKDNNKNSYLPLFGLGFGWIAYLWKGFGPRQMNHWIPSHPIFARHLLGCVLSIASIVLWLICLSFYASKMGLGNLLYHYAVPVFICGCYIVVVTFLHHSDLELPWYGDDSWDNVRGKLSSVDRDYGMIHDVIHTIGTHQVHHLFPVIPHYHLREATKHFRKAFPQLVHIRNTPILPAFWEMFFKYTSQSIVADDAKIHYYK